jgi:hypothetical protein
MDMDRREIYSLTGLVVRIDVSEHSSGVQFTIESASAATAVLRPCNREAKEFAASLSAGDKLLLTAGTPDSVLHGTLTVVRWSPAQRMLVIDNPQLEYTQRRMEFRVPAAIPVDVMVPDPDEPSGARLVRGVTHDLSQGGVACTVPDVSIPEGTDVVLVLHTESQPILMVVRSKGVHPVAKSTFRAQIEQITPFDQTVLAAELRRFEVAKVGNSRTMAVSR